jgi:MFS transporter, DHA2 family, multidrug resistance protein
LGLAIPAAMNSAIGALSPERSGSGTALITAMRQVGATIGVAVLGTVINDAYRNRLHLGGLPAAVAGQVRSSVGEAVAVAHSARSTTLLAMVRDAYVHGLGIMLWVCAAIALASALLALFFLPRRAGVTGPAGPSAADTAGSPTGDPAPLTADPHGTDLAGETPYGEQAELGR